MMVHTPVQPILKPAVAIAAVIGLILGALWFAWICYISTLPAYSNVSLCWAFRPWYRASNWLQAGIAFVFVTATVTRLKLYRL